MRSLKSISIFLFIFVLIVQVPAYAQDSTATNTVYLKFIKDKVEVVPGEVFHNVLIIENKKASTEEFDIFINSPNHWKVIGEPSKRFRLLPGERIYMPVQVASSGESKGGVGYVVTAVMNDINGNMIKAESCLLNIPRENKIEASVINSNKYFDLKTNEAEFQIHIQNTGNTDQYINIQVQPGRSLVIPNSKDQSPKISCMLLPKTDSTFSYKVKLKEDIDKNLFSNHSAEIQISGNDTITKHTAWFYYLDWQYTNPIPDTDRPLVIELLGNNIFDQTNSFWQARAYGKILFNNSQELRYRAENLQRNENQRQEFWYNSRLFAEYSKKNDHIIGIGDYRGHFEQSLFGRGIWTENRINKKHSVKVAATKKLNYDAFGLGGEYSYKLNYPVRIGVGGSYTENRNAYVSSPLGYINLQSNIGQTGNIGILYGYSISDYYHPDAPPKTYTGYGLRGFYTNKIYDNSINARFQYGSPLYSSNNRGRLTGSAALQVPYSSVLNFTASYNKQRFAPTNIQYNEISQNSFSNSDLVQVFGRYNVIRNVQLSLGPFFENKATDTYSRETDSKPFGSKKIGGEFNFRVLESYTTNSIFFAVKYGQTFADKIPESVFNEDKKYDFPYWEFRLNLRRNNWSMYGIYQQGPSSISEEYAYILSSYSFRSLMLMPTYEKWLYKKDIKFQMRATYINNLTAKSSRFNMSMRLDWYLPQGWSMFIDDMFSLTYQSPYLEATSSINGSQTSNYVRFGIKKAFNFNQPRVKYIDVNAVFYRDNNGNNKHSANEPGVPNVIAGIKRIPQEGEDESLKSEFNNTELLSEFEGRIRLKDIPAGTYELSYIPTTGREGNFITDRSKKIVVFDNDSTIHIPFTDRNKVYGHVIINKAENPINDNPPLDNITIVAESGGHKPERTLTNKEGFFELYIPVSDYYQIRIENFDSEHYTLRQPFYVIKFNGYKEFEINFVFDEKERRVVFDDDLSFLDTDDTDTPEDSTATDDGSDYEDTTEPDLDVVVRPLHQTNIRGEIREESTMAPLHADIQIINESTGMPITETISSLRTGVYATSFISSDNVYIRVEAHGYWVYKEQVRTGRITTFDNIIKDIVLKPIIVGQSIETSGLTFDSRSSELSPVAKAELENLLSILHENNLINITITGHTDGREALVADGDELSLKRAQIVAQYLKERGIQADRITEISGKADKQPKITETDDRSRAVNRRVEIKISNF